MHLIMIKRVVSNEHNVPVSEYIVFKTQKKPVFSERNMYFDSSR